MTSFPIKSARQLKAGKAVFFTVVLLHSVMAKDYPRIGQLPDIDQPNAAVIELGKYLFFETKLSGDGSTSCASCHQPENAFTDGMALSDAYPGSKYFRNTPTIINSVYKMYYYWDGRLGGSDKETQVRDAITETHFLNMDGRLMLERLKQIPEYVEMFKESFGINAEPSFGLTLKAIAAFEKSLISINTPFDLGKMSIEAQEGQKLFEGKAGCIRCHNGSYFSDGKAHNLGIDENNAIFEEPLRHTTYRSFIKSMGVPNYMNLTVDVGHYTVTKQIENMGEFITPTLREVSRTSPYMHNGMLATLGDVIEFYNNGGGTASNLSPLLKPLNLSEREKKSLVAFLNSLTGDEITVEIPPVLDYQLIENWTQVSN